MMDPQVIFKYPEQKFAGLATRGPSKELNHQGFALVNHLPKIGDIIAERKVVELLTDEKLLKECTARAQVSKIEVVAVLGPKVTVTSA
jgi:hypothetical protein